MELNQVTFLKLFELGPITPMNDSYMILEDHNITTLPRHYSDLFDKNNRIVTGYENFFIKKGTVKLFPLKDFDFIGKHVVCQKCCQTFASQMSYRAHVGTSICVRTYNGPNLVYLNYKNRHSRRIRKKNNKLIEDLPHHIKKNLLNPEMLNTLQTRNNCYSDVVHQRNKTKEKQRSGSDNSSVKKPRGRPKKTIEVPKKRGRPKKLNSITVHKLRENNTSSFNSLESNEIMTSADDAYNNNVNEPSKLKSIYTKLKGLIDKCFFMLNKEWQKDNNRQQSFNKQNDRLQQNTEDMENMISVLTKEEKNLSHYIDSLRIDLKSLSIKIGQLNVKLDYKKDLDAMLLKLTEKHDELKQRKVNMINELTANKGKENMHSTIETANETDCIDHNTETYSDHKMKKVENCIKLWMRQSEKCRNENNFFNEMGNSDSLSSSENNSESSNDITSSMNNHSNNSFDRLLKCRKCNTNFASIAEWKMHYSEHIAKQNNNFMCKICGHRFKKYDNYAKHVRVHEVKDQSEQERKIIGEKQYYKQLICILCGKKFNYLTSYYNHIRTQHK